MSIWFLMIAHFMADFVLQSAECAERKTKKLRYLFGHAAVYAIVMAAAIFVCSKGREAWIALAVIAGTHLLIDWCRVGIDRIAKAKKCHFASFLIDQMLHLAIIWVTVQAMGLDVHARSWIGAWSAEISLERMLKYILIFIVILDPASVLVRKLSACVSEAEKESGEKHTLSVGNLIGKLERVLIAILVLCDQMGTIGFVLAAKSLARYQQLNERDFAEKYLVGTLASTSVAVMTALLLK